MPTMRKAVGMAPDDLWGREYLESWAAGYLEAIE